MDSKYQVTYARSETKDQRIKEHAEQETAASATEVDPYQFGKTSSKNNRNRKRWWTKFILTILSAIVLGSLFGLLMLNIFSHEQDQPAVQEPELEPATEQPVRAAPTEAEGQAVELGALSGYVIQAGAFQDLEQANLTQEMFSEEGYQTVIWETDTDFRVFLAAYSTIEAAKQVGEQFIAGGFDVYAREWQSNDGAVTTKDDAWLIEFQDLWQQSLTDHSETVEQAWQEWATTDHEQLSETLNTFHQQVEPIVTQLDEQELPFTLLELWHAYDQLIE